MPFSFLQRGNVTEHARQLSLTSYEPVLVLENLVTGIDNVRHDVFLSPKFCDAARPHIFKLIAKHGNVEELAAADAPAAVEDVLARSRGLRSEPAKAYDPFEFKRHPAELHTAALSRAKAAGNVCLDLLFYLASLKFQRAELLSQYNLVLERCRARLKQHEGPRQAGTVRTVELRERFMRLQINKKAVLRRAGQDLFSTIRDVEKEKLGKTRRSLFGETAAAAYDLFVNRLLYSEDGQDNYLNAEHYVMLGNYDRDRDRFQTMQEICAQYLKMLGFVADLDDPLVDTVLNVPENAQEIMAGGAPDESAAKGKMQKALLAAWVELLERENVMEHVLASYEVVPLLAKYSPPINPQQLKNALVSREELHRVETLLEEHGKISPENLHASVKKIAMSKPPERS